MEKLKCYFYDQSRSGRKRCDNKATIRQLYSTQQWQKTFHYCRKHRRADWKVIGVSPHGFYSRRKPTTKIRKNFPAFVYDPLTEKEKQDLRTKEEFCRDCKKSVYDKETKTYFHTRCPCQIKKWPELYSDINLPENYDSDHV